MYRSKTVSIMMPCYNEEEGLEKVLRDVPSFVDEVIVSDNDSDDHTAAVARRHGARVVRERKRGYGHACMAGLAGTNSDITVMLDGDNSYPLNEIEKLLECMEDGNYDLVVGNRYPLSYNNAQPGINKAANRCISSLIRVLYKIDLNDSQSGMMAIRKGLLDRVNMSNPGMGFSQEIKIKTWTNPHLRGEEVHVSYMPRTGKVKFHGISDSIQNLYSVMRLREELKG